VEIKAKKNKAYLVINIEKQTLYAPQEIKYIKTVPPGLEEEKRK
jgi:hypothetical protein